MNPTHDTDSEVPDPAATLRGARIYLQRYGWRQDFMVVRANPADPFPAACVMAAIGYAACGTRVPPLWLCPIDTPGYDNYRRAINALADWLCESGAIGTHACDIDSCQPDDIVTDWNDTPEQTLDDVLYALTDAADVYDRAIARR